MITLQFSTSTGPLSYAIRKFTWSPVSHVDVVLKDGTLLGSRVSKDGAKKPGVQIRPANYEKFTKIITATVDIPPDKEKEFYVALFSQVGKPYDESGIWNFFRQEKRDWRETDSWFCSELVAWAFEQAQWPLLDPRLQVWRITPRDLLLSTNIDVQSATV